MDITIDQGSLHRALRQVARIAAVKPLLPILQHVLIEAAPGQLTLTASDLDVGVRTSIAADVAALGRTTVQARLLDEFVAALPADTVRLELDDGAARLHARSGRYHASFPVADPDDFPQMPEFNDAAALDLDASALRRGIDRVAFAAARDDLRPVLRGIHCRFAADGLTLTACDGFRLARTRVPGTPGAGMEVIVPARAAAEFGRLLAGAATARLAVTAGTSLHLCAGESILFARLLEGPFPDVERVIPKEWRTRVRVETAALRRAVGVTALFWSNESGHPLRLEVAAQSLRLHAQGVEAGDAQAELAAEVDGEPQAVSLGTPYLADILAVARSEQVELLLREPLKPVVVCEAGRDDADDMDEMWLLMPMVSVGGSDSTAVTPPAQRADSPAGPVPAERAA